MKQRIIFTMLLLSGALSSCGRLIVDPPPMGMPFVEYIYVNDTDYSVELIGYPGGPPLGF